MLSLYCVRKRYSTEVVPYVEKVLATQHKLELIIAKIRSKPFHSEMVEQIQRRQLRESSGERKLEIVIEASLA